MSSARTVALIGGIGCGKSTVARMLEARGAEIVDADDVARAVVEDRSSVLEELVAAFGSGILDEDGRLDRQELARLAFSNSERTATLNSVIHPAIGVELAKRVAEAQARAKVVVVAIPLFRPEHREALRIDVVVCVDCDPETARERLASGRSMSLADADARIAAQSSREERRSLADEVLENTGTTEQLAESVEALWNRLVA